MQTILQKRTPSRSLLLALFVSFILAASWYFSSARDSGLSLPDAGILLAPASARSNASTDKQVQDLQDRLRSHPQDWQAYSQLALGYLQKARETGDPTYYQKADEALNRALASQPDDYAAVSVKGALALARHDFHDALEWGERARLLNPERTYAYGVIADAQVELGRYEQAIETLQTMVDLRPDMSSYSRISYMRELHGDVDGALEMMQLAVDSGTPNTEGSAWVRTQLGNLYLNRGDLDRAELEYKYTLQDRPEYVYAIAGLGRVQAARGNMKEAIRFLNQAVALMPLPEFVITLGDLYQASGRQEEANRQYELVGAIEKLFRANGVDMDMEIALFNADHNRNLDQTLALAHKAYANRPSIHGADALAWALYKTGNYEDAQKYSVLALQLGTKDSLKLFHAGMIAHALHRDEQARQYLEEALQINPHFSILYADEAQEALRTLTP